MTDVEFAPLEGGEGLEYAVVKSGAKDAPKARVGDLVAIRFKSSFQGTVIDDTFKTENSYYYRVGNENVLRGLDLAVQKMKLGDRWKLKVPSKLAFGEKGIPPSPGKPRIPGGATIDYEVFFELYPGAQEDLYEPEKGGEE